MKYLLKGLLIFSFLLLVACTKITQSNFDAIHTGMTKDVVIQILGKPTTINSANFGGISGTSATWRHNNDVIAIVFINDKVQIKTFSHSGKSNIDEDGGQTNLNTSDSQTNHNPFPNS